MGHPYVLGALEQYGAYLKSVNRGQKAQRIAAEIAQIKPQRKAYEQTARPDSLVSNSIGWLQVQGRSASPPQNVCRQAQSCREARRYLYGCKA